MGRRRAIRCSAWGCLFLLWAGTALADATTLADTNVEPSAPAATDDCPARDSCIDQYLWSLYERTPKIDTIKVSEKRKVTIKRKGRTRTVTTTVTRLENEDFTWKDLKAAAKAGLSPMEYVIGGIDRSFKLTLYHALRALDAAGLEPGITSAFRDDYRQAIATGNKASSDRSFHGGSSRGGYGHGLAVDLVSVRGATRAERYRSSEELWTWIDAHGKDVGIGRPYLDRDAPHVAPIDGREYAKHRGGETTRHAAATTTRHAAATTKTHHRLARHAARRSSHARTVASSKHDKGHVRAHHPTASAKARGRHIHHTRADIDLETRRSCALSAGHPAPGLPREPDRAARGASPAWRV